MIFASVNSLVKNYGNHCAVDNLSFNVSEGEIFGLIGPNGAGTVSYTHLTLPTICSV